MNKPTNLEQQLIDFVKQGDYSTDLHWSTLTDLKELADFMNVSQESARGVLGSAVAKGLVDHDVYEDKDFWICKSKQSA